MNDTAQAAGFTDMIGADSISQSFQPLPEFRVHRLWRSGHAQTIVGAYLPPKKIVHRSVDHRIGMPDGDSLIVHEQCPPAWKQGEPIALLVHGLGGGAASHYMVRKADRLCSAGVRVYRLNLRGCGPGLKLARQVCHAGRSEDALAALNFVIERHADSPVSLIGFSMGGNIVLKLAGELGDLYPGQLQRVISIAPPIDLAYCCRNIRLGLNRIYDWSFVRGLNRFTKERRREVPDAEHIVPAKKPRNLYDFDDQITAPLSGFSGADDYYQRSSAAPLLGEVRVPTLIITADDDPVIPIEMFAVATMSPAVTTHITRGGGHLGFLARQSDDPDNRWLDWRIVEQVSGSESLGQQAIDPTDAPRDRQPADV